MTLTSPGVTLRDVDKEYAEATALISETSRSFELHATTLQATLNWRDCKHCGRKRPDHVGEERKCLFEAAMFFYGQAPEVPVEFQTGFSMGSTMPMFGTCTICHSMIGLGHDCGHVRGVPQKWPREGEWAFFMAVMRVANFTRSINAFMAGCETTWAKRLILPQPVRKNNPPIKRNDFKKSKDGKHGQRLRSQTGFRRRR